MKNNIEVLQDYCKQDSPNTGHAKSILELLYWNYAEYNSVDNKEIHDGFAESVSTTPTCLCRNLALFYHSQRPLRRTYAARFPGSLRLGVTLMTELVEEETI